MHTTSLRSALANVFQIPLRPAATKALNIKSTSNPIRINGQNPSTTPSSLLQALSSSFSTTAVRAAKKGGRPKKDQRISMYLFPIFLIVFGVAGLRWPSLGCAKIRTRGDGTRNPSGDPSMPHHAATSPTHHLQSMLTLFLLLPSSSHPLFPIPPHDPTTATPPILP